MVHGCPVLVREASAGGPRAVQAARNDDRRGVGQRCKRRGGGHGRLRQAHGDVCLGNGHFGEGHARDQVDLGVNVGTGQSILTSAH